jgi:Phage virion morphogenesis family.
MQTNLAIISQRYQAMRRVLITKVAAIMLKHTDDRFREQGWKDETLQPWQKRKSNKDVGRSILIKSTKLKRGNRIVSTTDHSVTMGNDVPYAKLHNDGFNGTQTVRAHSRKSFAKIKIVTDKLTKSGKPRKVTALKVIGDIQVKSFTRKMNMPERRYMGKSKALSKSVRDLITEEVKACFK